MVANAERRRGVKLFLGNASKMPFENSKFKTSFVNTGVVDYLDDHASIGAIMNEVKRVTDPQGKILVALVALTSQMTELLRYVGVLSDNKIMTKTYWRMQFGSKETAKEMFALIKKDPHKSIAGYVLRLIKVLWQRERRPLLGSSV